MNPFKQLNLRVLMFCALLAIVGCAIRSMPDYEKAPTLPQVEGTLEVPGLNGEVKVYRDKWGVPHIFTEDEHDLFFADGYVQAQDRLWEIYLFRAIATGRLCEMFGNIGVPGGTMMGMNISTLAMDERARVMGMKYLGEVGEKMLAEGQPAEYAQLKAFCDGINAFVAQHRDKLPIEFQVLYYQPEPYTVADIISFSRFYAYMLGANMEAELVRQAMTMKYGQEKAWKIVPIYDFFGPTIVPKEILKNRLPQPSPLKSREGAIPSITGLGPDAALKIAGLERAFHAASSFPNNLASNNWVVGPSITATGTAMLANDPHLLHLEPSLAYAMHLKGAGIDSYGIAFPGQPYIVMGHNRKLAWGATVSEVDTQDLFAETVDAGHPGKYLYKGEWRDFVVRRETIRIRRGKLQTGPEKRYKEKKLEIRQTIHGPIINDLADMPEGTPPLALRWTGWDFSRDIKMHEKLVNSATAEEAFEKLKGNDAQVLGATMMYNTLMKGDGIDDFVKAMGEHIMLNMNWVGADTGGNIAYMNGGAVPIRKKGIGAVPAPGESGEYDWAGFLPIMELPHAINPERGYMATANNRVVDAEWYPYVYGTNYDSGWRAWRIEDMIQKYKPITVDVMRRMQNDVHVKQAEIFVPLIVEAVKNKKVKDKRILEAAKILSQWNYEATIDSLGTPIFYETMSHLREHVLGDDIDLKYFGETMIDYTGMSAQMMVYRNDAEFLDNIHTSNKKEDRDDVLVASLTDAVKWLTGRLGKDMDQWYWGRLNKIKWFHPMGFMALKDMSIGPFPHPGGNETVRNAYPMGTSGKMRYYCVGGPVMRHIIDMGDPDNALLVIDGSESGQWLSPHYRDGHSLWYNSLYMVAEKRPEKIEEKAESMLLLKPGK